MNQFQDMYYLESNRIYCHCLPIGLNLIAWIFWALDRCNIIGAFEQFAIVYLLLVLAPLQGHTQC